ncbi:hypothetical protein O6H91_12G077100 [Diphasiastrum complanatum]|uniref:Uncharacterized protein n=1 Tax=Diphasiastrum complanatum TaxID=34168 RepID=A0ACC2C3R6_DIPCM|nr:hypothetical protein O6H91_12G077100 [Diphasiastrum complanatum]
MPGLSSSVDHSLNMQISDLPPEPAREADDVDHSANHLHIGSSTTIFDMFGAQLSYGGSTYGAQEDKASLPEALLFQEHTQKLTLPLAAIEDCDAMRDQIQASLDSFNFNKQYASDKLEQKFMESMPQYTEEGEMGYKSASFELFAHHSGGSSNFETEFPLPKLWSPAVNDHPQIYADDRDCLSDFPFGNRSSRELTDNSPMLMSAFSEKHVENTLVNYLEPSKPYGVDHQAGGISHCSSGVELQIQQKRKRSRPCKSSEEVESQRMTHIAVERNRRKQMNEHLRVLRTLMPGSYVQRGDQASIIGGAIEFVKELQQLLQCLEEQKRRKLLTESIAPRAALQDGCLMLQPIFPPHPPRQDVKYYNDNCYEPLREFYAEVKSEVAEVEVKMVGNDAFIKILSQRRPGQLLKTIVALENLSFSILHSNITTIEHTVLYSFNVKIGPECAIGVDDIASAIVQTFTLIHNGLQ